MDKIKVKYTSTNEKDIKEIIQNLLKVHEGKK